MTDRRFPIAAPVAAAVLVGRVVTAVVRDAADRRAADAHERFQGVDRTPRTILKDQA